MSGQAVVINYDPKQSVLRSLFPWSNPSLVKVLLSFEFWFFIGFHCSIVVLSMLNIVPLLPVDWKASGAFQYFTTFFLTFYNGNCYARYQKLYDACTSLMDATLLFVREMTVCFKEEPTWKHRLQATKWLLAAVDLFFMGVCGGKLSMKEWSEVVKKGLLTKPEAQLLIRYPGPEVVPILTTWTMICVADALELPCFHEKKNPEWSCVRQQKIAHLHNRLDLILARLMTSYREVSETLAQPIPFAYWHLMNLVFSLNFFLLALILASFQHYFTILPYGMALLTFMGLREVSNQLADPFGEDIVDFPIAKYLDYTFDHSICLLQGFSAEDAYSRVRRQVYAASPFNERQVRRHVKHANLYDEVYQAHQDSVYIWEKDQPLQEMAVVYEKESLKDQLRKSLSGIPIGKRQLDTDEADVMEKDFEGKIEDNQVRWLAEAEEDLDRLRALAPEAAAELKNAEMAAEEVLASSGSEAAYLEACMKACEELPPEEQEAFLTRMRSHLRSTGTLPEAHHLEAITNGNAAAGASRGPGEESAQSRGYGQAGAGVSDFLDGLESEVGTPLARRGQKGPKTGRAFQWGDNRPRERRKDDDEVSHRSFRMSDIDFTLAVDDAGYLKRQRGSDRGSDRTSERGSDRGSDKGSKGRGSDRGSERGSKDRGSDRGSGHGSTRDERPRAPPRGGPGMDYRWEGDPRNPRGNDGLYLVGEGRELDRIGGKGAQGGLAMGKKNSIWDARVRHVRQANDPTPLEVPEMQLNAKWFNRQTSFDKERGNASMHKADEWLQPARETHGVALPKKEYSK